ncbi:hypothetical protein [Sinorhizobium fredii]|uniref:hypothetical protein n=1 Tax=Rhizobium fredii TaxID=380 RepID=UPI0012969FFD|nr:hypothetical protein [Sinorhizobium fredii]MQW94070.1 hypothetical protein [Sinorhizobium fredii]
MAKAAKQKFKMMVGTGGSPDYMVFARKGDIALGIKLTSIVRGSVFGMPGTTWFGARLRSAKAGKLFEDEDAETKVVKLGKKPDNVWDAWPEVVWEKRHEVRASTTVGIFVRGCPDGEEAEQQKLIEEIGDRKMAEKMAAYLAGLAGADNLVVTERELAGYLDSVFGPAIDAMMEKVKQNQELKSEMEANIGTFGMQAALLKKVYGKTNEPTPEEMAAEDLEPAGDEDESDDD